MPISSSAGRTSRANNPNGGPPPRRPAITRTTNRPARDRPAGTLMTTAINNSNEVLVDCRNLWKVFGGRAPAAVKAISERGLSKTQVLQEFDCVVGVADASLEVRRGEIF